MNSNAQVVPSVRIATAINTMQPSERRVIDLIVADPALVVESTAQELAERAAVARSTVIRACQSLGYRGYPQLRVALAAELAQQVEPAQDYGTSALGRIRSGIDTLAASLPQIASVLVESEVDEAVRCVVEARRVLVLASGLSAPLASDLAMRLTATGRPADVVADAIGQQIAARQLVAGDACLIVSGSGSNESSLKVARAAAQGGAVVIALTSFARSPLTELSDISLVIAPAATSFRRELEHSSRVAHAIFIEAFVDAVGSALGAESARVRGQVLEILSDNLAEADASRE
ncbi:MurR/RpiR family transcriptional regulator [Microterricola viridarii]|nr:MurR/RpiR family transcriptional regulator [Microterricola viridarii]